MAPRAVDKEKKRERILRAALEVLGQHGISDFKMIQIAEAAAVGKGTIYEYFPSKESLISGSVTLFFQDYAAYVTERTREVSEPPEQIEALIAATCEFFAEQKRHLKVIFNVWGAVMADPQRKGFMAEMSTIYRDTRDWLSAVIRRGIERGIFRSLDSGLAASLILAMLDGLLYQAMAGLTAIDNPALPKKISGIILEGMLK